MAKSVLWVMLGFFKDFFFLWIPPSVVFLAAITSSHIKRNRALVVFSVCIQIKF